MTSVQERLQINRMPLDKWSVREQLCLASAVACSGDQNWMSVSRTLKIVCGNSKDALQSRPADWFSQKNCAVQYGQLLEDVETPKRKKRTSESSVSSSPATVEPPTEAILKRLTEERMQEIKMELRREQEEYAKLYAEIKAIQAGQIGDDQLLQMWKELEKEQEMQRIEEMKLENQLRERELKKQELQRSWRTGTNTHSSSSSTHSQKSSTDTTAVDMDVEEIIGTGKTIIQSNNNNSAAQIQTGTSPLLSSLLKSPTTGAPATSLIPSSPSVRNTAPTITTLLTGGSIPNQNQPALIPSHDEAVQLLTRPISGPPLDTIATPALITQNLLSPSQSAPTLSMLLEKNKSGGPFPIEAKNSDLTASTNAKVVENSTMSDSNNESVPMDIEEDLTATKIESNEELQSGDIDDTDPNEEQQLLEVFKNIGNIEELDIDVSDVIDEEVDFLKGVDEETPLDENIDLEQKLDDNFTELTDNTKLFHNDASSGDSSEKSLTAQKSVEIKSEGGKIEIISSDDSNDNIPLAAVASLESSKDRLNMNESSNEEHFLKDQVESAILKNELDQVEIANETSSNNSVTIKQEMLDDHEKIIAEPSPNDNETNNKKQTAEHIEHKDDVFVAPMVEEIKQESIAKKDREEVKEEQHQEEREIKMETKEEHEMNDTSNYVEEMGNNEQLTSNSMNNDSQQEPTETLVMPKIQPPPSISIADTDENSSSTDISVQTRKDEKHSSSRGQRKSPHETKTDDEMPNPSLQQMATPNINTASGNLTPRPTALRKLRDRDRSESPMIDDDATTHSDHSTTNQRSRRRYSSTPVIDSIPNSPASSDRDERELRTSKKSLLSIYNVLYSSKYSATLQRVLSDDSSSQRLDEICLRSIDFITIKRNIETGHIRSIYELQRDILWMCQNALMITKSSSATFKTILQFQQECQNIREFMANGCETGQKMDRETRDTKSNSSTASSTGGGTSKGRSGSRKSLRLS
ncbi:bromodomain-containing protein 8 isoform X2 [Lucilia cuprina]|uniref:bromodomain-containing protein 8 isoform X2 n=1 Tax=Lucilia cuprina TaxID=7375 RepID=UPI001F05D9F8|nr:bromodomain-containing protein 8 isoform X2 [Lucilia cuprina]